jgi:ATP-dependent Lon protease
MHFYIPGWEVDIIRGEMFSDGYGFIVDYLAEILRDQRGRDCSTEYQKHFELGSDISTRDKEAIHKTFSGLYKILFPHGEATEEEIRNLIEFSIEGRKRIKDQLLRLDATYAPVAFEFSNQTGETRAVKTLEEEQYPRYYSQTVGGEGVEDGSSEQVYDVTPEQPESGLQAADKQPVTLPDGTNLSFRENQRGVSFEKLFGPYFKGAKKIEIQDPYMRLFHQMKNLMELMEVIAHHKGDEDIIEVKLLTIADAMRRSQQEEYLDRIVSECAHIGIDLRWSFDETNTIHARHIVTDNGWKILLDRGLDIFQRYDMNDAFVFANKMQEFRACKTFEITYIRQQ